MDGPAAPALSSSLAPSRRARWRRQLPVLFASLLLLSAWLPIATAAESLSDPSSRFEGRADGGTPSQRLSPRPTPSHRSKPLAERIQTYRTRPLPKVAYVRSGRQPTIRHSADVARRASDAACLAPGTTAAEINALFASRGAGAGVLDLCPGTVYLLEETIFITSAGQGLRTLGGAAVARSQRAELRISSAAISTAVNSMNCVDCNDILISDLVVNGSRPAYGPLAGGEALLELGGASRGHSVLRTKIFDTRGWSSLHFMFVFTELQRAAWRKLIDASRIARGTDLTAKGQLSPTTRSAPRASRTPKVRSPTVSRSPAQTLWWLATRSSTQQVRIKYTYHQILSSLVS